MTAPTLLTLAGLAVMLVGERAGRAPVVAVAKPVASAGFVWAALAVGALESDYGRWILAGLAASLVGDVALLSRRSAGFVAGLAAFALAHLLYAGAFWGLGVSVGLVGACAAAVAGPALLVYRWLRPHVPAAMLRPVQIYVALICTMVALAAAAVFSGAQTIVLLGAVAFFVSDISVARERFVTSEFSNRVWGWPLYYGAQLLLAASVAS